MKRQRLPVGRSTVGGRGAESGALGETAAVSREMMHTAHQLNGSTYVHDIRTAGELISVLRAGPVAAG